MSTPSPVPSQSQGALEEASSPKSRVRITVLTILALHVVVIGGLLLQGCDKRPAAPAAATNTLGSLPSLADSTNYYTGYSGDGASNSPAGSGAAGVAAGGGAASVVPGGAAAVPAGGDASVAGGAAAQGQGSGAGAGAGVVPAAPGAFSGGTPSNLAAGAGGGLAPLANPAGSGAGAAGASSGGSTTEHVIRKGDTVGALARKYHVTEKAIIEANPQVKPKNLKVDDKLTIPAPVAAPAAAGNGAASRAAGGSGGGTEAAAAASGGGEVYVVKPGDTLAKIAKKFGVSVKALRGANNLKGDRIVPKQRLTLPTKAVPTTTVDPGAGRPAGTP